MTSFRGRLAGAREFFQVPHKARQLVGSGVDEPDLNQLAGGGWRT